MKNKILVPLLIVFISIIYGLPNLILNSKLGSNYTPFTLSGKSPIARDETYAYAPFVNYILQGHLFLKDVYVAEYSKYPTPFMGESVPSIVFALLAKITGSIENAFIVADFIFPPIIFLLLFMLAKFFIKNRLYALASAFVVTVARDFIAVIPLPHETIQYLTVAKGQNYLLYLSRAFHPQLTFIFLMLALISFIKLAKSPRAKKYIIASGITFGILFYSYVFYWTYFVVFFFLMFIYFVIKREKAIVLSLIISGSLAFVITIPYLLNLYDFYRLDLAQDFIAKASLKNVPVPLTLIRYFLIAALFFISSPKRTKTVYIFLTFLAAGIAIAPFSKIILGQDLETFHYLRRALMPFATIAFFITIYNLFKSRKQIQNILALLLIAAFIAFAIRSQIIATQKIQPFQSIDENQQKTLEWLRENTPRGSVIGSIDPDFESVVPVYTYNKVFFPPTDRTITPAEEGVTRYAILGDILSISPDWQKKNLDNIISYLFIYQSYNSKGNLDPNSPKRIWAEGEIERVSKNWTSELNRFKLDYVIVTPKEIAIANPSKLLLTEVASFGKYKIHKYKSQ